MFKIFRDPNPGFYPTVVKENFPQRPAIWADIGTKFTWGTPGGPLPPQQDPFAAQGSFPPQNVVNLSGAQFGVQPVAQTVKQEELVQKAVQINEQADDVRQRAQQQAQNIEQDVKRAANAEIIKAQVDRKVEDLQIQQARIVAQRQAEALRSFNEQQDKLKQEALIKQRIEREIKAQRDINAKQASDLANLQRQAHKNHAEHTSTVEQHHKTHEELKNKHRKTVQDLEELKKELARVNNLNKPKRRNEMEVQTDPDSLIRRVDQQSQADMQIDVNERERDGMMNIDDENLVARQLYVKAQQTIEQKERKLQEWTLFHDSQAQNWEEEKNQLEERLRQLSQGDRGPDPEKAQALARIQELEIKLKNQHERADAEREINAKMLTDNISMEEKLRLAEEHLQQTKQKLLAHEQNMEILRRQIESEKQITSQQDLEIKRLQDQAIELKSMANLSETEQMAKLSSLQNDKDDMIRKLNQLTAEYRRFQSQTRDTEAELRQEIAQIEEAKRQIATVGLRKDKEIRTLKDQVEEYDTFKRSRKDIDDQHEKVLSGRNTTIEDLNKQIRQRESYFDSQQRELEEKIRTSSQTLDLKIREIQSQKSQYDEQLREKAQEIELVKMQVDTIKTSEQRQMKLVQDMTEELKQKTTVYNAVVAEKSDLQTRLEKAIREEQARQDELKVKLAAADLNEKEQKTLIQEWKEKASKLQETLVEIKLENDAFKRQTEEMKSDNADAHKQLDLLRNKLQIAMASPEQSEESKAQQAALASEIETLKFAIIKGQQEIEKANALVAQNADSKNKIEKELLRYKQIAIRDPTNNIKTLASLIEDLLKQSGRDVPQDLLAVTPNFRAAESNLRYACPGFGEPGEQMYSQIIKAAKQAQDHLDELQKKGIASTDTQQRVLTLQEQLMKEQLEKSGILQAINQGGFVGTDQQSLTQSIREFMNSNNEQKEQLEQLKRNIGEHEARLAHLNSNHTVLLDQIQDKEMQMTEATKQTEQYWSRIQEYEADYENLQYEKEQLENEVNNLQWEVTRISTNNQMEKIEKANAEIEIQKLILQKQQEFQELDGEMQKQSLAADNYHKQLLLKELDLKKLQESIDAQKREVEMEQQKMQTIKLELTKTKLQEEDARSASTLNISERSRQSNMSRAEVESLFAAFTENLIQQLPQQLNPRLQVPPDNVSVLSRGFEGASLISFNNQQAEADLISQSTLHGSQIPSFQNPETDIDDGGISFYSRQSLAPSMYTPALKPFSFYASMPGPEAHQVPPTVLQSNQMVIEPPPQVIEEAKEQQINAMLDQVERQSIRTAGKQSLFSQPSGGPDSVRSAPKSIQQQMVSKMTEHVIQAVKVNNLIPQLTFKQDVAQQVLHDPIAAKKATQDQHELAKRLMKQQYTIEGREIIEELGPETIIHAFEGNAYAKKLIDKYVQDQGDSASARTGLPSEGKASAKSRRQTKQGSVSRIRGATSRDRESRTYRGEKSVTKKTAPIDEKVYQTDTETVNTARPTSLRGAAIAGRGAIIS